ncbi:hypothetical protein F5Y19DRAFT_341316 [Xylariaceae sp. FL1651]|nr:hypothetical protein F5Y19DRAFT_341316 [Xylariaceae sp. FL1651]
MASYIDDDEAPPPYSAAVRGKKNQRKTIGSTTGTGSRAPPKPSSAQRHTSSSALGCNARQFPPAFSMYREDFWGKRYFIGQSRDCPLYAVVLHSGFSTESELVLHANVSGNSPPMATVDGILFSNSVSIVLPPRPGSQLPRAEEILEFYGSFTRVRSFSIETNAPSLNSHVGSRERFEWRHSSGPEVGSLGGQFSGWKLVRLSSNSSHVPDPQNPPRREGDVFGRSSDGSEIVAVWAWSSWSMPEVLHFKFLGSGADGSLGDRWAIMAVISALAIWNKERKQKRGGVGTA